MKRLALAASLAAFGLLAAAPALAALKPGDKAPDFTAPAALAGKDFEFKLSKALKKGPVVLYFFPAAYTSGCTAEAHEFAEATPEFEKLGATVIGVTGGNVDRIKEFSKEHCRDKFAVAAASPALIKDYDVKLPLKDTMSNRTSYVIAPGGKVLLAYSDLNFQGHVTQTMEAVKAYKAGKKK
ncbi:peroxiredoxin [Caulobacter hibisci]|uniref:thioredoxin-dependent peroxiredoxin n=1 Tax=Caulobacter hibisci TaxID=2035993 RepID=A0ABS0SU88_9CAUL|nr:peroxiredoxin [Caulobacter hibisci]MBI1683183.1 peroxiredoxin [Caulobacter hibisci]